MIINAVPILAAAQAVLQSQQPPKMIPLMETVVTPVLESTGFFQGGYVVHILGHFNVPVLLFWILRNFTQ